MPPRLRSPHRLYPRPAVLSSTRLMLNKLIGRVDRTKRIGPALRLYLWWGLVLRAGLLILLGVLLVTKGNFLAEWLLSWRAVPSLHDDIEEYTILSYLTLSSVLAIGMYLRWAILRRMHAAPPADNAASTEAGAEE